MPDFFLKKNFCYEVIVKQKKNLRAELYYSHPSYIPLKRERLIHPIYRGSDTSIPSTADTRLKLTTSHAPRYTMTTFLLRPDASCPPWAAPAASRHQAPGTVTLSQLHAARTARVQEDLQKDPRGQLYVHTRTAAVLASISSPDHSKPYSIDLLPVVDMIDNSMSSDSVIIACTFGDLNLSALSHLLADYALRRSALTPLQQVSLLLASDPASLSPISIGPPTTSPVKTQHAHTTSQHYMPSVS